VTGRHLADDGTPPGVWIGIVCAGWLIVVATLTGWVVLPTLLGWQAEVVASGSMAPALHAGDVVIADPRARSPRTGQIVVVRDPDVDGGLLTHRVVAVTDGVLRTRGDANPQSDPRTLSAGDVVGTVRLVVPAAGWPGLLIHHPGWPAIVATALTVAALSVCLTRPEVRSTRRNR
jgi:signal peptidase I